MTLSPEKYGVHFDMPAKEYHALPGASASQLRTLWQSTPAHLRASLDEPPEENKFMRLGTFAHHLILEPFKPLPAVAIQPDEYEPGKKWTYAAKACKEWRAAQEAGGRVVLTRAEHDAVHGMAKTLAPHPVANDIFKNGRSEVSLITYDSTNDVIVRARIDYVPADVDYLADVKTTQSACPRDFERKAYDLGYHIQAALYLDLWNALTGEARTGFRFVAIEQKLPHCVSVFEASREFLAKGAEDYRRALAEYAKCLRTGEWPGYPAEIHSLNLPKYA